MDKYEQQQTAERIARTILAWADGDDSPEKVRHHATQEILDALRQAAAVREGCVPKPKRAYQFSIEVGADTPKEMRWALEQITHDIDRNINTQAVSGGPSSGWIITGNHTPEKTHEQYTGELEAWIAARDGAKNG